MWNRALAMLCLLTPAAALAEEAPPPASSESMVAPVPEDGFAKGTIGFSFPVTLLTNIASVAGGLAEQVPTINVLYFTNGKTAFDLVIGLNIHKQQVLDNSVPPMAVDSTAFGFAIGAGYRMYKAKGDFHTFLEPQAILEWGDTGNSATATVTGNFLFGAEIDLVERLSVSGAVGGGVVAANKFKDIQLATTATLAVNLYWK
jgi:hypothetical protein